MSEDPKSGPDENEPPDDKASTLSHSNAPGERFGAPAGVPLQNSRKCSVLIILAARFKGGAIRGPGRYG